MKLFAAIIVVSLIIACPLAFGAKIVIFDENDASEAGGGDMAALFTSHDAGSVVEVTEAESYSGSVSLMCTPSQSYNNVMAGWDFNIDDYPYLTFAWKKAGGTGIMVQYAHDEAWAYRYFSGENVTGWAGEQLEDGIPEDWKVYTLDLVADFGGGWKMTGMALTPWNGDAGYYDFMILHSEPEPPSPVEPTASKLSTTWAQIKTK